LFTASADLMVAQVAALTHEAIQQLIEAVVSTLRGALESRESQRASNHGMQPTAFGRG
jgi:hypothetical protein